MTQERPGNAVVGMTRCEQLPQGDPIAVNVSSLADVAPKQHLWGGVAHGALQNPKTPTTTQMVWMLF
jgi:hypothetical protein